MHFYKGRVGVGEKLELASGAFLRPEVGCGDSLRIALLREWPVLRFVATSRSVAVPTTGASWLSG